MAKDTFSYQNKNKTQLFTDTVKRIVFWNSGLMLLMFLVFNFFTISVVNYILNDNLNLRLRHEVERLQMSFRFNENEIIVTDSTELKEPDFAEKTEHPFMLQVFSPDGKILLASRNMETLPSIPFNYKRKSNLEFEDVNYNGKEFRTVYCPIIQNSETKAIIQLSVYKTELQSILNRILLFNLFSFPIVIIIIIIVSVFLAKKSYAPLNKIISIAENISAKNLSARINYKAHPMDELGRLRDTLNSLFSRLEIHIDQISQFTDNASHQLMNPLTAMNSELDFILKKDRNSGEYVEALKSLKELTDKMIKINTTLLNISKYSNIEQIQTVFNLSHLFEKKIHPQFISNGIEINIDKRIYLKGNPNNFLIAIENLLDNALKYSGENPVVKLNAEVKNSSVSIYIEDNGIGISDKDKENIFQRFFRTEESERLGIKGYGLGLSLVKTIILSMNGKIHVEDNSPQGSRFVIELPNVTVEEE